VRVKNLDVHFFANSKVTRELTVFNDKLEDAQFTLEWKLKDGRKTIASDEKGFSQKAGEVKTFYIEFQTPDASEKVHLTFYIELSKGKKKVFEDSKDYYVYPQIVEISQNQKEIAIFDPEKLSKTMLEDFSIDFTAINNITPQTLQGYDVLIIGKNAIQSASGLNNDLLSDFVWDGGRVVVFEQQQYGDLNSPGNEKLILSSEKTPSRDRRSGRQISNKVASTISFIRTPDHKILDGIEEIDLRFWGDNNIVTYDNIVKPIKGNFKIILDAGGEDGLDYSPLMEIIEGRGSFILSQLDLTEKYAKSPIAALFVKNIINYVTSAHDYVYQDVGLIASPNSTLELLMKEMNIPCQKLSSPISQDKLSPFSIIIIDGSAISVSDIQNSRALTQYVQEGGTLYLHALDKESFELLKPVIPVDISIKERQLVEFHQQLQRVVYDPIINGISNFELAWQSMSPRRTGASAQVAANGTEEAIVKYVFDAPEAENVFILAEEPKASYVIFATGGSGGFGMGMGDILPWAALQSKKINKPGAALVKILSGKGTIILDQILWEKQPEMARAQRIASLLLTNLSIK